MLDNYHVKRYLPSLWAVEKKNRVWNAICHFCRFCTYTSSNHGTDICPTLTHCFLVTSTPDQAMTRCLTTQSHYLNQCWLIISKVEWHSSEGNFTSHPYQISLKITYLKFYPNLPGPGAMGLTKYVYNTTDSRYIAVPYNTIPHRVH